MRSSGRVSARLMFAASEGMARAGFGDWPVRDLSLYGSTIAWQDFVGELERMSAVVGGPEGMRRLGFYMTKPSALRSLHRALSHLVEPARLFQVGGELLWPHLMHGLEHRFATEGSWLVHEMALKDGLEPCRPLWHVIHGAFEWVPVHHLGLEPSEVWLWAQARVGTFYVRL